MNGKRQRRSVYGATRREVQDAIRAVQEDLRDGIRARGAAPTLGKYLEDWLEVTRPQLRPKTITSYAGHVRIHILPALGRVRLDELTARHVERFLAEKARTKLSPTTVQGTLKVLRAALNHAVRTELIARNVAQQVRGPRAPVASVGYLTPAQARTLIAAVGARESWTVVITKSEHSSAGAVNSSSTSFGA